MTWVNDGNGESGPRVTFRVHHEEDNFLVTVMYRRDGSAVEKPCGSWYDGRVLCEDCERWFEAEYPQGWRYYPGDVCPHGRYTGGSGIDWMCGACEMGED